MHNCLTDTKVMKQFYPRYKERIEFLRDELEQACSLDPYQDPLSTMSLMSFLHFLANQRVTARADLTADSEGRLHAHFGNRDTGYIRIEFRSGGLVQILMRGAPIDDMRLGRVRKTGVPWQPTGTLTVTPDLIMDAVCLFGLGDLLFSEQDTQQEGDTHG